MADAPSEKPPKLRCESPSSDNLSVPPTSTRPELTRCVSTASSVSHTSSAITDASVMRESLGSDISAFSRHSSGSYQSSRPSDVCSNTTASTLSSPRNSTGGFEATRTVSGSSRRRGFMRPQGTDFAASARSRESVLNLGSIAHLQYYFARTGLLDGKGGQMARNRNYKAQTLDLSSLESTACSTADLAISDVDSSYASLGSSPEVASSSHGKSAVIAGHMVESPVEEQQYEEFDWDEYEEPDPTMLPPTVSTYRYREKPLPKPPSIAELKADLTSALDAASRALAEAKDARVPTPSSDEDGEAKMSPAASWYEIQGMHILDVMTLAIRAAKVYYTAHEQPDRLDAIKPEKQLRSELLTVMDVLKRMATRLFGGGLRSDEFTAMDSWIDSVRNMLAAEEQMEAAEAAERASWTWLRDEGWDGPAVQHLSYTRARRRTRTIITTHPPARPRPLPRTCLPP
ncbi:hypothetical protein VTK73DRAFT_4259 [Phialemonium thermophilum]|uniref:Uncharacterized protein n=1 Tax=Phialemonium thermophilum TaxID=223376 RepID=A0ABR3VA97_9PEZI